jgi:hypothetical protein
MEHVTGQDGPDRGLDQGKPRRIGHHEGKGSLSFRILHEASEHGGRDVGPNEVHSSPVERKGHPTGPDPDLQTALPAGQLGHEKLGDGLPHATGQLARLVVVAGSPIERHRAHGHDLTMRWPS